MDNQTSDMELAYRSEAERLKKELRDYLIELENNTNDNAKIKGQEAYNKFIEDAKIKVAEIDHTNQEKLDSIRKKYDKYEEELVDKAFQQFVVNNNG